MKLLLLMELLKSGSMNADHIPHGCHYREIIQALGIDNDCRVDRGKRVCTPSMMVGMIHNLDRADELPLRVLIRVGRVDNHTEEVVGIMLLHAVDR
jgi:hypothetical protein